MYETKFQISLLLVLLLIMMMPPSYEAKNELSFPFHRSDDSTGTYHDERSGIGNFTY